MVRMCAELGIKGFEFVNTFFPSPQYRYLQRLRELMAELGVTALLIMCDGEGEMASTDSAERALAVRNHHKWVDIAAVLGCQSIRCNVQETIRRYARLDGDKPRRPYARHRASTCWSRTTAAATTAASPSRLARLPVAVGGRTGIPDFGNRSGDGPPFGVEGMLFAKAVRQVPDQRAAMRPDRLPAHARHR
jgi:hypothetical protein